MENQFVRVTEPGAFETLKEQSRNRTVVIFKHSTTCPASAAAYREMLSFEGEVALVEVQRARDLSREIERKTGVRHESPQIIVLRNGQVVWDASHFQIKSAAVTEAVANIK